VDQLALGPAESDRLAKEVTVRRHRLGVVAEDLCQLAVPPAQAISGCAIGIGSGQIERHRREGLQLDRWVGT
jgi:hypothetical protein